MVELSLNNSNFIQLDYAEMTQCNGGGTLLGIAGVCLTAAIVTLVVIAAPTPLTKVYVAKSGAEIIAATAVTAGLFKA